MANVPGVTRLARSPGQCYVAMTAVVVPVVAVTMFSARCPPLVDSSTCFRSATLSLIRRGCAKGGDTMFRCPTATRLGISPFALFLIRMRGSRQLRGVSGRARTFKVAQAYYALSPTQLEKLRIDARKRPSWVRKHKRSPLLDAAPNLPDYQAFVKTNFGKLQGSPAARFQKLGKLWRNRRQ